LGTPSTGGLFTAYFCVNCFAARIFYFKEHLFVISLMLQSRHFLLIIYVTKSASAVLLEELKSLGLIIE